MTNGAVRGMSPPPKGGVGVRADMVSDTAFPSRGALTVAFAHVAYRAAEEFAARRTGVAHFEVRTFEELERRAREADVLVVSGLWRNTLLASAPKLRFVQSFSAGTDQYDKALFAKARRSAGQCPGRERTRGCGARDGAHPRSDAAASSKRATTSGSGAGAA